MLLTVNVDLSKRPNHHVFHIFHAFDISAILRKLHIIRTLGGIAILYRKGPEAAGACDPTGKRGLISHGLKRCSEDLSVEFKELAIAMGEAIQDLRAGNIQGALKGRPETNKRAYKRALKVARGGSDSARKSLGFQKKVRFLSDEDVKEVLRELEKEELEECQSSGVTQPSLPMLIPS